MIEDLSHYKIPPRPQNLSLKGQYVQLLPLSVAEHANDLYQAFTTDTENKIWDYLPYGPFNSLAEFKTWLSGIENLSDPYFFAIKDRQSGQVLGMASYLRINPESGSIEVGHINYSPLLQRSIIATEAMFLMMQWAFDNGYRRYEWKCNADNAKSRKAAQRLGFSYEGTFRQATIVKGKNRDTAWFAVIDKEWDKLKTAFERYLAADNFDENGQQRQSLSTLTHPLLYQLDLNDK